MVQHIPTPREKRRENFEELKKLDFHTNRTVSKEGDPHEEEETRLNQAISEERKRERLVMHQYDLDPTERR